jgi:hypothetical protein
VTEGVVATPRLFPISKLAQSAVLHLAKPPPDDPLLESQVAPARLGAIAITGRPSGVTVTEVVTVGSPDDTDWSGVMTGAAQADDSQTGDFLVAGSGGGAPNIAHDGVA